MKVTPQKETAREPRKPQDVDGWIEDLQEAGWKRHATISTIWVAPWGAWYRGPYKAWCVNERDSVQSRLQEMIAEAKSHLRTALVQVLPSDDKIIIEHMVQAYLALGGGLNDFLSERPFASSGAEIGSSISSELCRHLLLPEWCEKCCAGERRCGRD